MREALLGKLLLLLARASMEQLTATYRFLGAQVVTEPHQAAPRGPPKPVPKEESPRTVLRGNPVYSFRKAGLFWEVVYDGGRPFYVEDTLGARYLNYLLHAANKAIPAFEMEVAITPEKGEARSRISIQPETDAKAKREYRAALRWLELDRAGAREGGDGAKVSDLDREIKKVKAALREHGGLADTGERARNNVRHAIDVVKAQLKKGSAVEQAFAEHLETHLSLGIECFYSQAQGRIWA